MTSHSFVLVLTLIALFVGLVFAQGDSIPEDAIEGIPDAQLIEPRVTMLRYLRNDGSSNSLDVTTLLIRINDGNEEGPGTDTDLGSKPFRATFFAPTNSAWEQFARRLYPDGQVPDLGTPNNVAQSIINRFAEIRTTLQDVESLYRTVRYHIIPGPEYYLENSTDGVLPTLSGYNLTHAENGSLYDVMLEEAPVTGPKYLLSNGWIIPIEKVLIPFNITALFERIEAVPSDSPSVSPTSTPSPASASASASPSASSSSGSPPTSASASPSEDSMVPSEPMTTLESSIAPSDGPGESFSASPSSGPDTGGDAEGDPTSEGDDDGVCFPASSRVHLPDGSLVRMKYLQAGTFVVHTETGQSSRVFLFTHRDANKRASFKKITTACGQTLKLTRNHYLYVNGKLTAAAVVAVGDSLRTVFGSCAVTEVATVRELGLFAPHTLHGDLVVDGIVVSGYSRAIHPDVAHALLAPVRWFSRVSGVREPLGNLFYNGANWALKVMPRGQDRH